jgi:hypothetical protein
VSAERRTRAKDPGRVQIEETTGDEATAATDAVDEPEAPPATVPAAPAVDSEPRFSRERILDPYEGPRIVDIAYPVIVGALHGNDSADFTRAEVHEAAEAFLGREIDGLPAHPEPPTSDEEE